MKKPAYVIITLAISGMALYCGYQWGAFTYVLLFIFLLLLSWLLQKEIRRSILKNSLSEDELRKERDSLENEVRKKTDELKQSELSRMYELGKIAEFGRLSQGLFHDLLSPLSGLALHMEKAKGLSKEELASSHESLSKITETSKKMNETLERLRESMSNSLPARECDIKEEITHVIEILKFKAYEENVKVVLEEKDQCIWHGDPVKLQQIFSNIISNAIDAFENVSRDEKSIDVIIKKESGSCKVEIKDNGAGMTPELIEKIFTPYFTTKTPKKGSGVGLSIVIKILEEIGGEIEVKSTPGVGSTFILTIR